MSGISFKVIMKGPGLEKLKRELSHLGKTAAVKVGITGESAGAMHGEISMAELAAIHEYGSPKANIPERSFLRSTLDAKMPAYVNLLGRGIRRWLSGATDPEGVLNELGKKSARDVRAFIRSGRVSPPDKPARPRRRDNRGRFLSSPESHPPLDATGALAAAITYELQRTGEHA